MRQIDFNSLSVASIFYNFVFFLPLFNSFRTFFGSCFPILFIVRLYLKPKLKIWWKKKSAANKPNAPYDKRKTKTNKPYGQISFWGMKSFVSSNDKFTYYLCVTCTDSQIRRICWKMQHCVVCAFNHRCLDASWSIWQSSDKKVYPHSGCWRVPAAQLEHCILITDSFFWFVEILIEILSASRFSTTIGWNDRSPYSGFLPAETRNHIRSIRWQSNLSWEFTQTSKTKSFAKDCNLHRTLKTSRERTK